MSELVERLPQTIKFIRSLSPLKPKIGLILGSGLGALARNIEVELEISYREVPNFHQTTVEGHDGKLILGHLNKIPVVALQGRTHMYEGHDISEVVFPTQTLCMLGIETLICTSAAGGLSHHMKPGDLMIINDHINMLGANPLRGRNSEQLGPRFPDLTEAYDKKIIRLAERLAEASPLRFHTGTYIAVPGPTYETPAEVRFLQLIGGSAVGMSTVPEVIAANHLGVRCCGISCITNMAAGISANKLSHGEVTQTAKRIEGDFQSYIQDLVTAIDRSSSNETSRSQNEKSAD